MEPEEARRIFPLSHVARSIQMTLRERYGTAFWVKAEMNRLHHYAHSGHCHPELVEKEGGKIVAQLKAHLWRDDYRRIDAAFQERVGEPLKDGIKILFLARITYDPVYGLSLHILDIDPEFTLGDLERERSETIRRLKAENLFLANKRLPLPSLVKRIAVISVESSKGYVDFMRILQDNANGYVFFTMLFPSLLQGDKAIRSIVGQLERIRKVVRHFDAVAVIRGGGGEVGLSCYNNYELARAIATFPLPVLTGIGHATNETVCELVSSQNGITPTKIAEFLIDRYRTFDYGLTRTQELLSAKATRLITLEKDRLHQEFRHLRQEFRATVEQERGNLEAAVRVVSLGTRYGIRSQFAELDRMTLRIKDSVLKDSEQKNQGIRQYQDRIRSSATIRLHESTQEIDQLGKTLKNLDPREVLKRGFSITRAGGKIVRTAGLDPGTPIETELYHGKIKSVTE